MMKKIYIIFLLFTFTGILKSQSIDKIVPLVLYNPTQFTLEIEKAFEVKSQYIRIKKSSDKISYFLSLDKPNGNEDEISEGLLKNKGIDPEVLNTSDSIFLLNIEPFSNYTSRWEILGKKDGGKYYFRSPKKTDDYQSLEDFINHKYGVNEVFKYYYLNNQNKYLTYEWNANGLLDADPTKAYNFFKEDYAMYGVYNPKDTIGSINLFVNLISKSIQITSEQKSLLSTKLFDEVKKTGSNLSNINLFFNFDSDRELTKGIDLNTILLTVLTSEQADKIIKDLKIQSSKRYFYYENMRKMYPAYARKVETYFVNSEESIKELSTLVFEPKKWNPKEKVDSTFINQKYLSMMGLKYRKPNQFEEVYIRRNLAPQLLYGDLVSNDKNFVVQILAPCSIYELKETKDLKSIQNEYLLEINTQLERIHNVKNPNIEKYAIVYPPQQAKKLYNADKAIAYDDTNYSLEGKKQFVRVIYVIKEGKGYFSIYCIVDYDKRANIDNYLKQVENILVF